MHWLCQKTFSGELEGGLSFWFPDNTTQEQGSDDARFDEPEGLIKKKRKKDKQVLRKKKLVIRTCHEIN